MQSIYFCKTVGVPLNIYVPVSKYFVMNFNGNSVKIDLDSSYLASPFSAVPRATELAAQEGIKPRFFTAETFNTSFLPVIPSNFDLMCCPWCTGNFPSTMIPGRIGPRAHKIIRSACFPVLITSPGYKKWRSIAVFYGGSGKNTNALKLGFRIGRASGFPVDIFTQIEKVPLTYYEKVIEDKNLKKEKRRHLRKWHVFEQGGFEENLYKVPHDALVVLNAHGYSPLKKRVLGSKAEKIQATLLNNLLIAGPNYKEPNSSLPAWFPSI